MTTPTRITIVAAVARNGAIGRRGDLLYHIREDLRRFKEITMGKPVIMGRKTFESFPNGALPGRRNIVITRNPDYAAPGVETAPSLEAAIAMVEGAAEAMVIGGGEIYRRAMPVASAARLTVIDAEPADADTFMPAFSDEAWTPTFTSNPFTDSRSGVTYRFVDLVKSVGNGHA